MVKELQRASKRALWKDDTHSSHFKLIREYEMKKKKWSNKMLWHKLALICSLYKYNLYTRWCSFPFFIEKQKKKSVSSAFSIMVQYDEGKKLDSQYLLDTSDI